METAEVKTGTKTGNELESTEGETKLKARNELESTEVEKTELKTRNELECTEGGDEAEDGEGTWGH